MTQPSYPITTYHLVGATPMKRVRFSDHDVRVYAFDFVVIGDFVAAPDQRAALDRGQSDDVEPMSEADFEAAVTRLRAQHETFAAQGVERTYFDDQGVPVMIAHPKGRSPFAYIVLSNTGELAWSTHHLMHIVYQKDSRARSVTKDEYERRVAEIRAALQRDDPA